MAGSTGARCSRTCCRSPDGSLTSADALLSATSSLRQLRRNHRVCAWFDPWVDSYNPRIRPMNKSHVMGAAALLSLLALQPAIAQDAVTSASSVLSSALSSEPAGETNYGNLISSLQAGGSVDVKGV